MTDRTLWDGWRIGDLRRRRLEIDSEEWILIKLGCIAHLCPDRGGDETQRG